MAGPNRKMKMYESYQQVFSEQLIIFIELIYSLLISLSS